MTVKLTADRILISLQIISSIIREKRPMPQKGKFAFARMHAALLPEFKTINEQRDEIIKAYDFHPMVPRPAKPTDSEEDFAKGFVMELSEDFAVPEDKMAEFAEKWKEIGETEITLNVEPISIKLFDLGAMTDGSIEANEILEMGDLITE
jgi:hypothetical protein